MLIVLVVVAVIASYSLNGMKSTLYSTRLTGSFVSHSLALQRAELALLTAFNSITIDDIHILKTQNQPEIAGRYSQFVEVDNFFQPSWFFIDDKNMWQDNRFVIQQLEKSTVIVSAYIIEKLLLLDIENKELRRITAKGWGYESNTTVIIQALVKVGDKNEMLSWQIIH